MIYTINESKGSGLRVLGMNTETVSRFRLTVCHLIGLNNAFASAYLPEANGQVERYNRTILYMLRCHFEEHKDISDRYASSLTYAYNN